MSVIVSLCQGTVYYAAPQTTLVILLLDTCGELSDEHRPFACSCVRTASWRESSGLVILTALLILFVFAFQVLAGL